MIHILKKTAVILLAIGLTLSLAACGAEEAPVETGNRQLQAAQNTTPSTETDPTEHTGAVSVPTQTEPTTTQPTVTRPDAVESATTQPTVTKPGSPEPPVTVPPVTVPPVTQPAVTVPVVTVPPTTQPPATESPATKPAQPEYEYGDHYIHILNYSPSPDDHSHLYWGPWGSKRIYEGEYVFDVDYRTITYELWCSWDNLVQLVFRSNIECDNCANVQMTPDESYYYRRIVENDNYTCGYENHYCAKEVSHIYLMRWMAEGCKFCGKTDCVSFLARDEQGFTSPDGTLCPEYDVYRDPWFYCQECNMPTWQTVQDVTKCCHSYIRSVNCHDCGVWVEARACHTCKQEDIDAWNANQQE